MTSNQSVNYYRNDTSYIELELSGLSFISTCHVFLLFSQLLVSLDIQYSSSSLRNVPLYLECVLSPQ